MDVVIGLTTKSVVIGVLCVESVFNGETCDGPSSCEYHCRV